MRIVNIELSGFRGFANTCSLDLDADAIIVIGANGRGKTSLFDAILWALTGTVSRLGEQAPVVSKCSESGEAYVSLSLKSSDGELITITRSTDGQVQRLGLAIDGKSVNESLAASTLFEKVWPEALLTTNGIDALAIALTRSVYLQQDLVRQFIESDKDQERFKAVSELVGVGRVTELQSAVERAKNAWSRATTAIEKDLEEAKSRRSYLMSQFEAMQSQGDQNITSINTVWTNWWQQIIKIGIEGSGVPLANSVEAPNKVDEVMKQLNAIRRSNERRILIIDSLISDIQIKQSIATPDVSELRLRFNEVEKNLKSSREKLVIAESFAADERRRQIELRESHEELITLANLALRHLDSHCPVCGQEYDHDQTRQRLEKLIGFRVDQSITEPETSLNQISDEIKTFEQTRTQMEAMLREAEDSLRKQQLWKQERDNRLKELNIRLPVDGNEIPFLSDMKSSLENSIKAIILSENDGEKIALMLAKVSELARKSEISTELESLNLEVVNLERSIRERESTSNLSSQILNGLRDAGYFVVERQLKGVESLLQSIYATIDPHPSFRTVRFLANLYRGHGLLSTQINDSVNQISSAVPQVILSSSQIVAALAL